LLSSFQFPISCTPRASQQVKVLQNLGNMTAFQRPANESAVLAKPVKGMFDPKAFLAKVGVGKSISKFVKGHNVFVQGDVADAVFYIQKGKIKLTVVSDQGKEAVVGRAGTILWRRLPQQVNSSLLNAVLRDKSEIDQKD
jgi:hypothetical protein